MNKVSILNVLIKKRYYIVVNALLVGIITAVITLFIQNKYKSTIAILVPSDGGFGLSGILGDLPISNMLPVSGLNSSIDNIVGIIESRTVKDHVIKKFKIDSVYQFDGEYYEDLLGEFEDNITVDIDYDQSIIKFYFLNENSQLSARIANYYVSYVDSIINVLYGNKANKNKLFLSKRIDETKIEIEQIASELENFQKKNKIFLIPDQLQFKLENYAALKAQYDIEQISLKLIEMKTGLQSSETKLKYAEVKAIKSKLDKMVKGSESDEMFEAAIMDFPELSNEYYRMQLEFKIKKTLLEFLYPQYEQAKLEEKKQTPNVLVVDYAVPAQKKSSPRRSLIVLAAMFIAGFFALLSAYVVELKAADQLDPGFINFLNAIESDYKKFIGFFSKNKV